MVFICFYDSVSLESLQSPKPHSESHQKPNPPIVLGTYGLQDFSADINEKENTEIPRDFSHGSQGGGVAS